MMSEKKAAFFISDSRFSRDAYLVNGVILWVQRGQGCSPGAKATIWEHKQMI